jgi:hypothetical protein
VKVSPDTVMRDWRLAKVWLSRELRGGRPREDWLNCDFLVYRGHPTQRPSPSKASVTPLTGSTTSVNCRAALANASVRVLLLSWPPDVACSPTCDGSTVVGRTMSLMTRAASSHPSEVGPLPPGPMLIATSFGRYDLPITSAMSPNMPVSPVRCATRPFVNCTMKPCASPAPVIRTEADAPLRLIARVPLTPNGAVHGAGAGMVVSSSKPAVLQAWWQVAGRPGRALRGAPRRRLRPSAGAARPTWRILFSPRWVWTRVPARHQSLGFLAIRPRDSSAAPADPSRVSRRLRTFDITPDGKQIVFDRSRQNSDVVLIELPKTLARFAAVQCALLFGVAI